MLRRLRQLGAFLLDLVYPPVCVLCGGVFSGGTALPRLPEEFRAAAEHRGSGDDDPAPEPGFGFSFGAV